MGGFKEMTTPPDALFIIDPTKENIALAEARQVGIQVVAVADTNCNPDEIDYPIPANDDAIRAIKLICGKIADAISEGTTGGAITAAEPAEEEGIEGAEGEEVEEVKEEAKEEAEVVEVTEPLIYTPDDD